ncbi:hypothetical protein B0H14DRAFT_3035881, partial [Mycena olivaceomarginata]
MRTSNRRIRRPIPTPRRPATRPSTSGRDARMPASRCGASSSPAASRCASTPGTGAGAESCRGIALCCTCPPLLPPLLGDPSNSRSSRPGDLLARLAARAALLVCLHVGVPQMGSGGVPRDVRGADVLELRRPCVQRRAREEVVCGVLCALALARALA